MRDQIRRWVEGIDAARFSSRDHGDEAREKLKFYKGELEAVVTELRQQEVASYAKKPAKVLPFVPKKPVRSA